MQHGIEGKQTWVLGKMSIYSVTEDKANISGPIIRQLLSFKEQFGTGSYNKATPIGDAMKSAATNALEKCASLYDIAHEAYKGLIKVPEDNVLSVDQKKDVALHNLLKVCKEYKVNKEVFSKFVMNVLKEEKSHKDLTPDEIQQLIDHLEKYKAPF